MAVASIFAITMSERSLSCGTPEHKGIDTRTDNTTLANLLTQLVILGRKRLAVAYVLQR